MMPHLTRHTEPTNLIVPAADRASINNALLRLGHGPDTFSVPCNATADPDAPITHYGCTWVLTAEDLAAVLALLTQSGIARNSGDASAESFDATATRTLGVMAAKAQ